MATLVIIVIKIGRYALLRVRQVVENGPFTGFEFFGFEARPETFRLRVVEALGPATL